MSRMQYLVQGGLLAALFAVGLPLPAAPAANGDCHRASLALQPRWVFHGSWLGAEELVLVDVIGGRLLRYNRSGTLVGTTLRPGKGPLEFDRPFKFVETGDGFFLVNRTDHLIALDGSLAPTRGVRLRDLELPDNERVTFMWPDVASGERFVGLTRIQADDGAEWWGFAQLTLGRSPRIERLAPTPSRETDAGDAYTMFGPLVARVQGNVFALRFEPRPRVEQLLPSRRSLQAFPVGYHTPRLPRGRGPEAAVERYQTMETATIPVALYGRDPFLYVLTRKPSTQSGTTWMLHQIDPASDSLVRSGVLPTTAPHVVVVPGETSWAIVEKGVVGPGAQQHIGSVVFLSSELIERGGELPASCDGGRIQ